MRSRTHYATKSSLARCQSNHALRCENLIFRAGRNDRLLCHHSFAEARSGRRDVQAHGGNLIFVSKSRVVCESATVAAVAPCRAGVELPHKSMLDKLTRARMVCRADHYVFTLRQVHRSLLQSQNARVLHTEALGNPRRVDVHIVAVTVTEWSQRDESLMLIDQRAGNGQMARQESCQDQREVA